MREGGERLVSTQREGEGRRERDGVGERDRGCEWFFIQAVSLFLSLSSRGPGDPLCG